MYELNDTFNGTVISRHRTAYNAGKAARKYNRQVKAHNGDSSYIPMSLTYKGEYVQEYDLDDYYRGLNGE